MSEIESLLHGFRYGRCYGMAYTLSEALRWEIECISAHWRGLATPHIVHAWVTDAQGRPFDALGFTTHDEIHSDFIANSPNLVGKKDVRIQTERYETPGKFLERVRECYGTIAPFSEYLPFFLDDVAEAADLVRDVIVPRHLGGRDPRERPRPRC